MTSLIFPLIIVFGYLTIFFLVNFFRTSRLKKLAKKYSLNFKGVIQKESGIKKFNAMNGVIGNVEVIFYDNKRKVDLHKEIQDRLSEQSSSEIQKKLYPNVINTSQFLSGSSRRMKTSPERTSYLTVGNITKKIGKRAATVNVVKRSDLYMSVNLLEKIFGEIKNFGLSDTFNSLSMGDEKKFYRLTMPYVVEIDN